MTMADIDLSDSALRETARRTFDALDRQHDLDVSASGHALRTDAEAAIAAALVQVRDAARREERERCERECAEVADDPSLLDEEKVGAQNCVIAIRALGSVKP